MSRGQTESFGAMHQEPLVRLGTRPLGPAGGIPKLTGSEIDGPKELPAVL